MDETSIRPALGDQRRALAAHLDDLTPAQWATPSLCDAWTVQDVVAHLTTTTRTTLPQTVRRAVRARMSFDRMERDHALERSARYSPADLLAQLRETADSPRRAPGSAPADPLVDVLVHGQDVAVPLGLVIPVPPDLAVAGLERVLASRVWGAAPRVRGLRLVASDVAWERGEGPVAEGPSGALLAAVLGRRAVTGTLTGAGVDALLARR